jgi:hydrogenase expression/formation protein HypE
LIAGLLDKTDGIRFMRDLTRGGLATVMCEIADHTGLGIHMDEGALPTQDQVRGVCEMMGLDPLYLANEGKFVLIVDPGSLDQLMDQLKASPLGADACVVGEVVDQHPGRVVMETPIGGKRIIDKLTGEQLPRIC